MKSRVRIFSVLFLIFSVAPTSHAQYARLVDPFLGTTGDGNVIPGPAAPFGMIRPGPDMMPEGSDDANAGWSARGDIRGFSQTHVSGTGGGPKYGNIMVMPTTGEPAPLHSQSPRRDEKASAGYYAVALARYGINVEITTGDRAAIYRFTYPEGRQANLLFDVWHCLRGGKKFNESQYVTASQIHLISPTEVEGSSSVAGGWNMQVKPYTLFFYAQTDTAATASGTWLNGQLQAGSKQASSQGDRPAGAWLAFPTRAGQQVLMKIGISFISIEQARQNVEREIPRFDFEAVHNSTLAAWDKALGKVELEGETPQQAQVFYTALYHTMLMPTDRTGENPLWKSAEPYYDDYYAIWDIFRTSGPLLTLIAPDREEGIVRSLVDIYRHEGWLPDARSGNSTGRTQGGSNAEFMITDAYVKGMTNVDWETAYKAEVTDAEVVPPDPVKEGRGGLEDWLKLGYVSIEGFDRPGSVDMEYAADDFEVALLAKGLGKTADYHKYLERSGNWKNLWDSSFSEGGFTGFIRPRHRDGSWLTPFTAMMECSWGGNTFYEGNSWTYSTFVPQDVASLIKVSGGPETFVKRLDAFFQVPRRYDVGNEPGFLSPYLYNWAGRPDKTAEHVRAIIAKSYHAGRNGLPGNDDSGAMSSWYAFGQTGIFPNAGQDVYLIGSPAYAQTTIHLAGGKNFVIEARYLSAENLCVTAASLNGKPLNRSWLRHGEVISGGRLVLTMGKTPSNWARTNLPPSTPPSQ